MQGQPVIPDLTGLPTWAQVLIYGIFGLALAGGSLTVWLGLINGKKAPSTPNTSAEVAAVIVNPAALQEASSQVKNLTYKVEQLTDAIERMTLEMVRNGRR